MDRQIAALIVARSVQIRESLLVLLRAIPQIETVHQTDDSAAALALGPEVQPCLVLLDHDLSTNELRASVGQIKAAWPQTQCLVLLDDEQGRECAEGAGADAVLVKGIRAATVLETIEELLSRNPPSCGPA